MLENYIIPQLRDRGYWKICGSNRKVLQLTLLYPSETFWTSTFQVVGSDVVRLRCQRLWRGHSVILTLPSRTIHGGKPSQIKCLLAAIKATTIFVELWMMLLCVLPSYLNCFNECLTELEDAPGCVLNIIVSTLIFLMSNDYAVFPSLMFVTINVIKFHLSTNLCLFLVYFRGMVAFRTPCTVDCVN